MLASPIVAWQHARMGEIINLRRVKKARAKVAAAQAAEANRARHGRSKAERAADEAARRAVERRLDGALVEREAPDGRALPPALSRGERET